MGSSSSSPKSSPARRKPSDIRHNAGRTGSPSNIPLFSQLPTEWLIILLSEWLDIKDVAKLDMVMTNHNFRAGFLQLLESIRSTFVNGRYCPASFPKLQWLSLRRIYVNSVELDRFEVEQFKILKLVTLRKLILRDVDELRVLNATINCSMLLSLEIYNKSSEKILTESGIGHIGSVCTNLEHFSYKTHQRSKITSEVFMSILHGCQILKSIELDCPLLKYFTASEIGDLLPFGHLFTTLEFPNRNHDTFPDPPSIGRLKAFSDLIARCPNMKKIKIGNTTDREYSHEDQDDLVLFSLGKHCPLVEKTTL